ncbi:probable adenylate kinase 5, chloroplastic isoform X2 [Musa acuminata AAA Group]|uniref:probable adenylate kinase 5, chloroplastic isoform X2 n=1 Tax=Musa acuminata AAA Group TaxID=214697 RepID=UPI0031CF1AF6
MATATATGIAINHRRRPAAPALATLPPSSSSALSPIRPSLRLSHSLCFLSGNRYSKRNPKTRGLGVVVCAATEPLKVMISGAPASGKGTQCQMIVEKYGLVHISTGDLLRAEVSSGTEIGKKAKEYMDTGMLVPDEIVTDMVVSRLSQKDVREKGWLLDGYPRSSSQAGSLERMKIRPDIFIVLEVPDEILIDRCVGRRMDPVSGKIYHLKNFPPETEEISARLITRTDDTQEKVDGNRPREIVFQEIDALLQKIRTDAVKFKTLEVTNGNSNSNLKLAASSRDNWRGIPTRLNNIPHSKEIRKYFYDDVLQATQNAIEDKIRRLKVEINIPELNPETDVYRIGTLLELVRTLALSFADDGKRVKVCVQGSMGEGALSGMPLQLAGSRKIMEFMDWGEYGALGTFINIGSIGAREVEEQDDLFILMAPQNAVGNCIIDDMKAMTDAAGDRPVILVNPRLKDMPASSGIMQTMGREKRLEYAASFENCYFFRLLYYAGTQYPIMGALRMSYPHGYELYKRIDESYGKEKYKLIATFPKRPTGEEINAAFEGKPRDRERATGIWGFLSGIL